MQDPWAGPPDVGPVRPLLGCRDAELREYLEKFGEEWREDASNSDTSIERNKVRHEIIPFLEKHLDRKIVNHLYKINTFSSVQETENA